MTAERWWVRVGARWMARVEAVKGIIDMLMLIMTGLSTALIGLKSYGYSEYAWPLIFVVGVGTVIFTYGYAEGGVWNQKQRDSMDMSSNFSGPNMLIDDTLIAHAVFAALNARQPTEEEREALRQTVRNEWQHYRNGADLNGGDE